MFHLRPGGMPVGISPDSRFTATTFQLETNDVLVAYTDGITDVENRHGELWGQRGLESLLRSCSSRTPEQIIKCILDELSTFSDRLPQRDDMTLVVMQVQDSCILSPTCTLCPVVKSLGASLCPPLPGPESTSLKGFPYFDSGDLPIAPYTEGL